MIIFTMATANITFEMAISFFSNIIIPLFSALSLGKIIQIWVENKYKQSKKISQFEEDLITIYSNIYFSLITDPVTNKLHKESSEMLTELFLYLQQHKEFSIYFDEKTLTLLKPFNPDSTPPKKRIHFLKKKKSNNEAAIFKKRIERKYKKLLKKKGMYLSTSKESFLYQLAKIASIVSLLVMFVLGIILFITGIKVGFFEVMDDKIWLSLYFLFLLTTIILFYLSAYLENHSDVGKY